MVIADELRRTKGISVLVETLRRSMKAQMREANRSKAQFVIIIGEQEVESNLAQVKNMESGEQFDVALDQLAEYFSVDDDHHH